MIFISYRRSDGKSTAQLLRNLLLERGFDKNDVFLDLHDILGENFKERCRRAISSCDVFLLLITKDSFPRKKESKDHYFDEIHQALDENKKIIPVLYETTFDETIVPNEFIEKELQYQNAIRYDIEYQNDFLDKLVKSITKNNNKIVIDNVMKLFTIPLVFITIYLGVSLVGGIIRYVWDNYWLSEETCVKIASENVIKGDDNQYYYCTQDSIYIYK